MGTKTITTILALGAVLAACGEREPTPTGDSATDVKLRGNMLIGVDSTADDVNGFWIRVYTSDWSTLVAEQWAPLESETLPVHLLPGAGPGHAFGDAYFTLPAGTYNVRALPMVDENNHSRICADAEREGVIVKEGLTTEIVLVSQCGAKNPGGLDVIVTTNHGPSIVDLDFLPSKFPGTCEPLVMKVQVKDPEGDAIKVTWEMLSTPMGAAYETDTSPDGLTWYVLAATPGDYEGRVTACDATGEGSCGALVFPIHVTGDAFPSVERCPRAPETASLSPFTASDILVGETGDETPPGAPYAMGFAAGENVPADFLAAWRWFRGEMGAISVENPDAQAMTAQAFGEQFAPQFLHWLDSLPALDAEVSYARSSNGVSTQLMAAPPEPIIDSTLDTCDRPSRGFINTPHCSGQELVIVQGALDHAHFQVWRMRQLLTKILAADDTTAAQLWAYGGDPTDWDYEENNFQPHNWFGAFNRGRAQDILGALDDIWNKYLAPGNHGQYQVQCYPRPTAGQRALWTLSGQWWKFANPCYWTEFHGGTTPAHHFNGDGPDLCSRFFEESYAGFGPDGMRFRGSVLVHEFLHRTWVNGHLVKDTHYGVDCDWEDGAQKCYSEADSMGLAANHPDIAIRNNSNYEAFGRELAEQYLDGACTDPAFCSERDQNVAACNPPEPTYPGCDDPTNPQNFGLPGCPCADVDVFQFDDVAEDYGAPDGSGSYDKNGLSGTGQYCEGPDVVCALVNNGGLEFSRCETCGAGSNIGCPCNSQNDCQGAESDLYCWGLSADGWGGNDGGKCLPSADSAASRERLEEMPWFCLDNCDAIDAYDNGLTACVFNQTSLDFSHGECIDLLSSCPGVTGECEESGNSCNFDDVCEQECLDQADCIQQGFPAHYVCDAQGDVVFSPAHCVPPECGNVSSAYCNLYR